MIGEDVLYLSVAELGSRIRSRKLSPVELTEGTSIASAHRAQAERVRDRGRRCGAGAGARGGARDREGAIRGPLHGIPYGAKDLLATRDPDGMGARPRRIRCSTRTRPSCGSSARRRGAPGQAWRWWSSRLLGYRFADASIAARARIPGIPSGGPADPRPARAPRCFGPGGFAIAPRRGDRSSALRLLRHHRPPSTYGR